MSSNCGLSNLDDYNTIFKCDDHPYDGHFKVCYNHFEMAVCDKDKVTACLPSWNMYDQLMEEMCHCFREADKATSVEEEIKLKRLEKMFDRKAQDILNQLKK